MSTPPGGALPPAEYLEVIARAPLVSIDLIVRNVEGRVLVGLRRNEPAAGTWFVPGGTIRKNEALDAAFARISHAELGFACARRDARFVGVFEHFYPNNFLRVPGIGTHYVVLAHALETTRLDPLPPEQHSDYRWMSELELREHPQVHAYTRAYFTR